MAERHRQPFLNWTWIGQACAGVTALASLALVSVGGCGEDGCPETTEELSPAEVDLYRQLEVCASRVTGTTLHRDDLPRVETDPDMVECDSTPTGRCVTTPAEAVAGFYLPECDTFTVALREVLFHEMVHPILCGVPDLDDCDPGHTSPVWQECQTLKQCPDGRVILAERLCDGTPDCAQGEDEMQCP